MIKYDLSNKELQDININEINIETTDLDLSNNQIKKLTNNIFNQHQKIWNINLNNNKLISVDFLSCFRGLNLLDIIYNNLNIDDLLIIKHIFIIHLKLIGNPITKYFNNPLINISIFKRCWIIDNLFITDELKNQSKEFKSTLNFSEIILQARRDKQIQLKNTGIGQTAKTFLKGNSLKFSEPGIFLNPNSVPIQNLTKRPQIERIRHLYSLFPVELPTGSFLDYFSIILGILSHQWCLFNISIIPKLLSRSYWLNIKNIFEKCDNWLEWIYLYHLNKIIQPIHPIEIELWESLNLIKYLETGIPPLLGSTPRLIISAFIFRSNELEEYNNNYDILLYKRFRILNSFESLDDDLLTIHKEILNVLPFNNQIPKKGQYIFLNNPLTNIFIKSIILNIKNGRVFSKFENILFQNSISTLFWDKRGYWKETNNINFNENIFQNNNLDTFMTEGETIPEELKNKSNISINLPLLNKTHIAPTDPTYFLKTGQQLLNNSPFINRQPQQIEKFRGIIDPKLPIRKTIPKTAPSRRPNQFVENVVNIIFTNNYFNGHKLRKFHVKLINPITKKTQYIWINEDEVSNDDVQHLIELYKIHIENKMTIVPGF